MDDTRNRRRFSAEVRERAVRMVCEHRGEHASRWAAVTSISAKIGCTAQTLRNWIHQAEVDAGRRAGVPGEVAEPLKAPRRGFAGLRKPRPN